MRLLTTSLHTSGIFRTQVINLPRHERVRCTQTFVGSLTSAGCCNRQTRRGLCSPFSMLQKARYHTCHTLTTWISSCSLCGMAESGCPAPSFAAWHDVSWLLGLLKSDTLAACCKVHIVQQRGMEAAVGLVKHKHKYTSCMHTKARSHCSDAHSIQLRSCRTASKSSAKLFKQVQATHICLQQLHLMWGQPAGDSCVQRVWPIRQQPRQAHPQQH